jgi:hypothetical protein
MGQDDDLGGPSWDKTLFRAADMIRTQSLYDDLNKVAMTNSRIRWTNELHTTLSALVDKLDEGAETEWLTELSGVRPYKKGCHPEEILLASTKWRRGSDCSCAGGRLHADRHRAGIPSANVGFGPSISPGDVALEGPNDRGGRSQAFTPTVLYGEVSDLMTHLDLPDSGRYNRRLHRLVHAQYVFDNQVDRTTLCVGLHRLLLLWGKGDSFGRCA